MCSCIRQLCRERCKYINCPTKGRFGTHRYDLDEFGLDGPALTERFADYVERYQIPLESRDSA